MDHTFFESRKNQHEVNEKKLELRIQYRKSTRGKYFRTFLNLRINEDRTSEICRNQGPGVIKRAKILTLVNLAFLPIWRKVLAKMHFFLSFKTDHMFDRHYRQNGAQFLLCTLKTFQVVLSKTSDINWICVFVHGSKPLCTTDSYSDNFES